MANIVQIFYKNAEALSAAPALVERDRSIGYAELRDDVVRVAGYLHERGIRAGDNVLIFVPMSSELYTLLLAIFHLGAVAVFIDAWADRERLAVACRMVPIRAFIGTPRAQLLRLLSREIRKIPLKLVARIGRWRSAGAPPPAEVDPEAAALVTFTTGSTGAPKGARRSHRFLLAQHHALVDALGSSAADIDMPVLPIFVLSNLALGVTTVLPPVDPRRVEEFDPAEVARVIREHGVVSTSGSPAFYAKLAEYLLKEGIALPSLRRIALGGAPVFPRLARLLLRAFPDAEITIVYGSTEAEPVSVLPARELIERAERHGDDAGLFVGKPVESISVAIVPVSDGLVTVREEIDEIALTSGAIGEICVAGEHVLQEYYGDPATWRSTKIVARDRTWHRTGDGGYLDADGNLFLVGRVAQSFMHEGESIFVFPIEERLQEIEGVAIGTIVKVGEQLVIVVELERGASRDSEAMERALRDAGIGFDRLVILDAIPRDPRHHSKIDYRGIQNSKCGSQGSKSRSSGHTSADAI